MIKMNRTRKVIFSCILVFVFFVFGVSASAQSKDSWFDTMWELCQQNTKWSNKKLLKVFDELRIQHSDHKSMMEMSWEMRDSIWHKPIDRLRKYEDLANRYQKAYIISCHERGIQPDHLHEVANSLNALRKTRAKYLESRQKEYIILTPPPSQAPHINSALVYGVRPGNEIIYKVATTGERPLKYVVGNLPEGCVFDYDQGVIRGHIENEGQYQISVSVQNDYGNDSTELNIHVGDRIALTPPMGWNSWNAFGVDITVDDIKKTADVLIRSGLSEYGWNYVNIDDCWMLKPDMYYEGRVLAENEKLARDFLNINKKTKRQNEKEVTGKPRDKEGRILSNKDFPDMKELTDYIHQYGLKAGLYSSPGPYTCQIYEGSYGYELIDAERYAEWGFDFLKYDWCGYRAIAPKPNLEETKEPYRLMGDALRGVSRDIVYSLCQYGREEVWKWGGSVGGNMWRTTGDIHDNWNVVSRIGFRHSDMAPYAGPGYWNDPDMLVVGYVGWSKNLRPTYLSPNEQYSHISLWSLLAAPLLIGCDLTKLDDFTFGLLSNSEVIAVNQDILGKSASRVRIVEDIQVWSKPLSDGSIAVGIFNLGEEPIDYSLLLSDLGLSGNYRVRDLWRQEDVGKLETEMSFTINRHGVKLIKIY